MSFGHPFEMPNQKIIKPLPADSSSTVNHFTSKAVFVAAGMAEWVAWGPIMRFTGVLL
jgi:hypothetical protein